MIDQYWYHRPPAKGPSRNFTCFLILSAVVAYHGISTDVWIFQPRRQDSWGLPSPCSNSNEDDFEVGPFDWNRVNLTAKANCGMAKCFFDSSSTNVLNDNASPAQRVGYLVASPKHYQSMRRASELATNLTRVFGAQHFYMQDAEMVVVTPALVRRLNSLVHQPLRIISNKTTKDIYNEEECFVVVQKVLKAPTPTLTFGSSATKVESLPAVLPDFRRQIPNTTALAEQLQKERSVVYQALVAVPTLWRDFQGMIDVQGNFFFIDLDGHFSKKVVTEDRRRHLIRNRMERFDTLVEQLLSE